MRIGSLFSGYGGLDMAVADVLDGTVAWHAENDAAASRVLAHHWPDAPNLGDVTAVDWDAVEAVDVLTGGFPCQDLSYAGKRAGLRPGTRSGLWAHMAHAIDRLRPRLVVAENVRGLLSADAHSDLERDCWCVGDERKSHLRALGAVLGDLADLGYDAEWVGVRASDVGAPHGRFRIFIVAYPAGQGLEGCQPAGGRVLPAGGGGEVVSLLPTPKASDGPNGGPGMRNGRGQVDALPAAVLMPTPTSQAAKHASDDRGQGTPDDANLWAVVGRHPDHGKYAPALARWATIIGRPTPPMTEPNSSGNPRLSAPFVEWMMGLPDGHVTSPDIGLSRAQALKALGNGVVPQQAAQALRMLLGLPAYVSGATQRDELADIVTNPRQRLGMHEGTRG